MKSKELIILREMIMFGPGWKADLKQFLESVQLLKKILIVHGCL